jgi:hypothetical protein
MEFRIDNLKNKVSQHSSWHSLALASSRYYEGLGTWIIRGPTTPRKLSLTDNSRFSDFSRIVDNDGCLSIYYPVRRITSLVCILMNQWWLIAYVALILSETLFLSIKFIKSIADAERPR